MQDIFATRARDNFAFTLRALLASLREQFPDCDMTRAWQQRLEAAEEQALLREWREGLLHPLAKKGVKYAKAVASITGRPACVYDALAFRDLPAITAAGGALAAFDLGAKLEGLGEADRALLWRYVRDLGDHSFAADEVTAPVVPSADDIRRDIDRRRSERASSAGTSQNEPIMTASIGDLWTKLCEARGVASPAGSADIPEALRAAAVTPHGPLAELCQARDPRALTHLAQTFPYLGDAPLAEAEWEMLTRCLTLSDMHGNIPAPMMKGIEDVANKLVRDLNAGSVDLASLDVDAIGKQVLAGVGADDISAFTRNMDKILPAMQRL